MSDENPKRKSTLDVYQQLVEVQIRELLHRTAELTQSFEQLLIMAGSLTSQIETTLEETQQHAIRLATTEAEVRNLRQTVARQRKLLDDMFARLQKVEQKANGEIV